MVGLLEAAGVLTGPKNGEIPESALSGISLSVVAGTGNHLKLLLEAKA